MLWLQVVLWPTPARHKGIIYGPSKSLGLLVLTWNEWNALSPAKEGNGFCCFQCLQRELLQGELAPERSVTWNTHMPGWGFGWPRSPPHGHMGGCHWPPPRYPASVLHEAARTPYCGGGVEDAPMLTAFSPKGVSVGSQVAPPDEGSWPPPSTSEGPPFTAQRKLCLCYWSLNRGVTWHLCG